MQPLSEIEKSYQTPDPWCYKSNPEDQKRKSYILHILDLFSPFNRALDIGCGEGWITEHLRAAELWGYEISDTAASRFPFSVKRANPPEGKFELVVATGVLYGHYNWKLFTNLINKHASRIILTSNIKSWELDEAVRSIPGKEILKIEFPYNEHKQRMRIFDVSTS
jgi:SAM-dependent methyltransferase